MEDNTVILTTIATSGEEEKHHLQDIRVIQRNLVYIIGIPQKYADDLLLKRNEFFGQFGMIKKFVLNKRASNLETTASAYITFYKESDAMACISEIDESYLDDKILRATYGTTKYCSFYLKNIACQNIDCMYLHEKGKESDSLTKDEMSISKHKLHNFEGKNKFIERIGKKSDFVTILNHLFKYKTKKRFREPEFITFKPADL